MKKIWKTFGCPCGVVLLGLFTGFGMAKADGILLSRGEFGGSYTATITGTINGKPFDQVKIMIRLSPPSLGDPNPYLLVVQGLPEKNSKNSFFWISSDTTMNVNNQTIVCKTSARYIRERPDIFFFYVSPILLEPHYITQHEDEDREQAEQLALPTKIFSNSAELTATFAGGRVKGTVKMAGYDFVENAYTHYQGSFAGTIDSIEEQKLEKLKNIGSNLVEPGAE